MRGSQIAGQAGARGKPPMELSLLGDPELEGNLAGSLSPYNVEADDELLFVVSGVGQTELGWNVP
jgi:hypothetical protein